MSDDHIDHIDEIEEKEVYHYPEVSERIKAAIADSIVLVLFMILLTAVFSNMETVPDSYRIIGFIFIFLLYDPLFTSLFGGTIGHMIMKIEVKRKNNYRKNIILPLAILRYIAKVSLGIISLVTMGRNDKNLAIHDMLTGSIVLYRNNK